MNKLEKNIDNTMDALLTIGILILILFLIVFRAESHNKFIDKLEDLLKQALESTNQLISWAENICKECMAAEAKYQISQKEFVKHLAELPGKMWQNFLRKKLFLRTPLRGEAKFGKLYPLTFRHKIEL